jgi:hypothetical protein
MEQEEIIINIEEDEWEYVNGEREVIWKYKGKYLAWEKTDYKRDGWYMRYCDAKGNIYPDSPRIFRTRQKHGTVDRCVRIVD